MSKVARDIWQGLLDGWDIIRDAPMTACALALLAVVWLS